MRPRLPKSNAGAPTTDKICRHAEGTIRFLRAAQADRQLSPELAAALIWEINTLFGALVDAKAYAACRNGNQPVSPYTM